VVVLVVGAFLLLHVLPFRVATYSTNPPGIGLLARLDGVLGGEPSIDGTACLWVGSGKDRIALIWPQGYIARGIPRRIVDEKGRAAGTVGHRMAVGGGRFWGGLERTTKPIVGCWGVRQAWLLSTILPTSPTGPYQF